MELILIVSAVVLAAAAFCVKAFGLVRVGKDERGLSTLEWMLLVAAVGGLATLGVLIVRSSLGSTDDIEETVDNPTVMAARESVANIDNRTDCVASDAGGHMGVKTQWDEDEEECIIVEGANTIAAADKNKSAEDAVLAKILGSMDTSARRGDDVRGCSEGENADGFFNLRLRAGSVLELVLPTLTGCNEGKWAATGDYAGYTFASAEVRSLTRCYTAGIGGEGTVCAEDPDAPSPGSSSDLHNADRANGTTTSTLAKPQDGDPAPNAGIRDTSGEDVDIALAQSMSVTDQGDKIICSSEGSAPRNPCQTGVTAIPQGLFRAVIRINLEHASEPAVSYEVTDYLLSS